MQLRFKAAARAWQRRLRDIARIASLSSLPTLRIVRLFRDAGALTPATARPFRSSSHDEAIAFARLVRLGIIREPRPGRYYLEPLMLPH